MTYCTVTDPAKEELLKHVPPNTHREATSIWMDDQGREANKDSILASDTSIATLIDFDDERIQMLCSCRARTG